MKNEIKYICACGCELDQSQLIRTRSSRRSKKKTLCIEHRGVVVSRKRICADCGEYFFLKPMGPGGKRCKECGKIERARKRKITNKSYTKPERKRMRGWKMTFRGDYCQSLLVCKDGGKFDCHSCDRFFPIFRGVDPDRLGIFT